MYLHDHFNLSSSNKSQQALATLVQLSREQNHTYQSYHNFFDKLAELVDQGICHLSLAEFTFYLLRLCQASVPVEKAIGWLEGSLIDIDRQLSELNHEDILVIADYIFSKPFAKLTATINTYKMLSADKKKQHIASTMADIINNFAYLVYRQLQSRHLLKPHHRQPTYARKLHGNFKKERCSQMDPNTRQLADALLNNMRLHHLPQTEMMAEGAVTH